jgi:hypothetical protein
MANRVEGTVTPEQWAERFPDGGEVVAIYRKQVTATSVVTARGKTLEEIDNTIDAKVQSGEARWTTPVVPQTTGGEGTLLWGPRADFLLTAQDLVDALDADSPQQLPRRIYKDTACGAWISVRLADGREFSGERDSWPTAEELDAAGPLTVTIGSIVEGSDAEVQAVPFTLPCPRRELTDAIQYVEDEADRLWREANGGDDDEEEEFEDEGEEDVEHEP